MSQELNERAQKVLKAVVERYIRKKEPVGSKTLVEEGSVSFSPATVRNIMAELVEAGYLQSPHPSAGRVPTHQGYRLFVDSLLTMQPLQEYELARLQQEIDGGAEGDSLVEAASSVLSSLSRLAGLVTVPRHEKLILRHVEFLPLSDDRVLVVLVVNEKEVQNRVITTHRKFEESDLQQAANYLNAHYIGKNLTEIRKLLKAGLYEDQNDIKQLMTTIMDVTNEVFNKEPEEDFILAGETNLLTLAEEAGLDRLRTLFEAFNQKGEILHLLDRCLDAEGVQIFIGEESGFDALEECSLITAPYKSDDKVVGVLGVIGPTRMAYDRVIAMVDITAKLLSAALKD